MSAELLETLRWISENENSSLIVLRTRMNGVPLPTQFDDLADAGYLYREYLQDIGPDAQYRYTLTETGRRMLQSP